MILKNLPALLTALFIAVLFVQSGLDKVFDRKGNLSWLTEHFSRSILAGTVPLMLGVITLMEVATGFIAAAGIIYFLLTGSLLIIFLSGVLSALTLTALFFGQRVAKDYAGAAVLVPYFIISIILIYLSQPK